jgi:tetratricopeptide (TPR) repeat protein
VGLAAWETYLGEAYLIAGRLDDAARLASHSLGLARERKERGFEAHALRLTAAVAARHERAGEAEDAYRRALALATELGMRPLAAHTHLGLAALYRRSGDLERAEEHRRAASGSFGDVDIDPGGLRPDVAPG